jgi:hypothetical protein
MNYKQAIENAEHLKALGQTEVSIMSNDDGEPPWHLATECEPGGSHRFDMATSVWFRGKDPETGLRFRWTFDLEPWSANGKGTYEIDTSGAREVLSALPAAAATKFRAYLADCSAKVMKQALEYQSAADRLYRDANTLTALATERAAVNG